MTKLSALLATGRISNLPTVWCNCLTAALLLIHSPSLWNDISNPDIQYPTGQFYLIGLIMVICSSLLYVGGCFLGDGIDTEFDRKHKPDRPIPSGILSKKIILGLAWLMLLTGLLLPIIFQYLDPANQILLTRSGFTTVTGWQQLEAVPWLFLAIVLYSVFHKKSALLGLPLIGLCRFTLVIFAASITAWLGTSFVTDSVHSIMHVHNISYLILPILVYASAVCIYTISFASVARTESSDSPISWRKGLRYLMMALPFAAIVMKREYIDFNVNATFVAVAIYMLWMSYAFIKLNKNKGEFVAKSLAGFCLLDACFIAQFGWMWLAVALGLFALSLFLQKFAPAT